MDRHGTRTRHRGRGGTGGPRSEEAAKRATRTENTLASAIGLISNLLRFHSRYYHKRMVLLLGLGLRFLGLSLRLLGTGLGSLAYSLWGYQPFWLALSFGATCRVTYSLLALLAIRLVRFGSICLLRVLAFEAARLAASLPSACPSAPSGETGNTHISRRRRGQLPAEHMACPHAAHLLVV